MKFTKNEKRLIKDALDERYQTLFRAVMDLAIKKVIPPAIIVRCKKDLNELQGLRTKFKESK